MKTTMVGLQRNKACRCGVLPTAIRQPQAMPTGKTGGLHEKATAITDVARRLAFLNRGRGWDDRKPEGLSPRVQDDAPHADLAAMLRSHQDNVGLVASRPQGGTGGGRP